nr:hypothetical protein [Streptomyces sp. HM190]
MAFLSLGSCGTGGGEPGEDDPGRDGGGSGELRRGEALTEHHRAEQRGDDRAEQAQHGRDHGGQPLHTAEPHGVGEHRAHQAQIAAGR